MKNMKAMTKAELSVLQAALQSEYSSYVKAGKKLDMSRGKPGKAQLELSSEMLSMPGSTSTIIDNIEAANYGILEGLPSCRKLFAELLGTNPENVFIGGSASLNLMFDTISKAYTHGLLHSIRPWSKEEKVKFICVVPGYDRHFSICESFNMEMLTVQLNESGPDMARIKELIKDPSVKGMWCVPKYSNPDGISYSDEVIKQIASLKPAAPDFLLMWDNAYCVHEFDGSFVPFIDILSECQKYGNADMVFEFASTSKITFPGAGVSCFACSTDNMAYMKKILSAQTISYDKLNQLRHVLFFKDRNGVLSHMKKHAAILKPKFDIVLSKLNEKLRPAEISHWVAPKGGYFVSIYLLENTAKRTRELCKNAGLVMTEAGATYPHHDDPMDNNLRIAPSFPTTDELSVAMDIFCCCALLAATERLLVK